MKRVRISTTVDGERLALARKLTGARDADMIDRALDALIEHIEADAERDALRRLPYDRDPEVTLPRAAGADLPYDGGVPREMLALARRRRSARGR